MNKIIEALVAIRNSWARQLGEGNTAIVKLDEVIEARGEPFMALCKNLALGESENTFWERAIQYEALPIEEVIKRANEGDAIARGYLCAEAGLALGSEKPLPPALERYVALVLLKEAANSRGRGRPTEWARNAAIVFLLEILKTFEIPPTRSEGTDTDEQLCGSRIVAEWLNDEGIAIGEPGVAKVWEKYHEPILALKARHKKLK